MKSGSVRLPAVAGTFYPADPDELRHDVDSYIQHADLSQSVDPPKAIVAPHAGYAYSGPIAGSAYARLKSQRETIARVVMLSPTHRVGFQGIATPGASAFRTPLGDIPVDRASIKKISTLPFVIEFDQAHEDEHGLEVHLPFLQETFRDFSIVPLVVGNSTSEEVAVVLEILWGGPETLILISSDLSHYLPYNEAVRLDKKTSHAIERLNPHAIGTNQACGRLPLHGLLIEAAKHKMKASTVDLRNSGDTAGRKDQVVGYGAYVFS